MEGKKAYILPALAALVLGVLLVLRPDASDDPPADGPAPVTAPPGPDAAPQGVKARIRAALADAPDASLSESARARVHEALSAVVDRCRASRPDSAANDIEMAIDVIAAAGVGTRVESTHLNSGVPDDLAGCVREGVLGSKPPDVAETGRASWRLKFGAS